MILDPAVIALLSAAFLVAGFCVYAAFTGWRILRHWDLASGSERQLALERRTYLVSAVMSMLLAMELFSLLLFIYSADRMHLLFVGAMCAAGSLSVNAYGYPALVMKIVNAIACGVWLVLNRLDSHGRDYPLIQAITLLTAAALVFIMLIVDILFVYIDPRIKYE